MDNLLVISCIFGFNFNKVHHSPDIKNSFFFTNNPILKNEIVNKGWNYIYVDKPISNDSIISSLQSKYIKFLEFLKARSGSVKITRFHCVSMIKLNQQHKQ